MDYLEHRLDLQNKKDELQAKNEMQRRKNIGDKIIQGQRRDIIGDDEDIDESQLEAQLDRGDSRL